MKILVYLYYPFYENHLAGGVQVWLKNLIRDIQLKNENIKFQIVCPVGNMYEYPKDISVDHSLVDMEQDFFNT